MAEPVKKYCLRRKIHSKIPDNQSTVEEFAQCLGQDCPLFVSSDAPNRHCLDYVRAEMEIMHLQARIQEMGCAGQRKDGNEGGEKKSPSVRHECLRCGQKVAVDGDFCFYCLKYKGKECEEILKKKSQSAAEGEGK